jgi:predicted nucleic acid-binding Zn ribbon protein
MQSAGMTASTCPNCNHPIIDDAETCDHCGKPIHVTEPVAQGRRPFKQTLLIWLAMVVLLLLIYWLLGPGK